MWPTMLAAVARRYPGSGSWGIGIVGFGGATAICAVLPEIGKIYDRAKLQRAGGEEPSPNCSLDLECQDVLAYAAEQSFKAIAVLPPVLFLAFGVVWLYEKRLRKERLTEAT